MMQRLRRTVYSVLDEDFTDRASRRVNVILIGAIALSIALIVLSSVQSVDAVASVYFESANLALVILFAIEYVLRVWTCTEDQRYSHPVWGRLRFMVSPMMIVDFLAIAPAYIVGLGVDLRSIRIIRALRLLRVLKLVRYVSAVTILREVVYSKRHQLGVSLAFVAFLLLLTSSLMYEVEHEAQPDAFSSIPATMWWAVASLTTVGYGDIYPITPFGKLLASVTAILGVGLIALPTGILASGFSERAFVSQENKHNEQCPHCGKEL